MTFTNDDEKEYERIFAATKKKLDEIFDDERRRNSFGVFTKTTD